MGQFGKSEFLSLGVVGEVSVPKKPDDWVNLNGIIATKMLAVMPTEQDHWWFLVEQFDRSRAFHDPAKSIMDQTPMPLHEIEFDGRRSENSYVGKANPGVVFLNEVQNILQNEYNSDLAEVTVSYVYVSYVMGCIEVLKKIRLKYAVHFHNNCISSKSYRYADQWHAVIKSLGGI